MAYDQMLAARVQNSLEKYGLVNRTIKMMGGICFMVDDKMCVGVHQDRLMARVGPEFYPLALERPGCEKMELTKREMKGFVFVNPPGYETEEQLDMWIEKCLEYNPVAKSSKKRTK